MFFNHSASHPVHRQHTLSEQHRQICHLLGIFIGCKPKSWPRGFFHAHSLLSGGMHARITLLLKRIAQQRMLGYSKQLKYSPSSLRLSTSWSGSTEPLRSLLSRLSQIALMPALCAPLISLPRVSPTTTAVSEPTFSRSQAKLKIRGSGFPMPTSPEIITTSKNAPNLEPRSFSRCRSGAPFVTSPNLYF